MQITHLRWCSLRLINQFDERINDKIQTIGTALPCEVSFVGWKW